MHMHSTTSIYVAMGIHTSTLILPSAKNIDGHGTRWPVATILLWCPQDDTSSSQKHNSDWHLRSFSCFLHGCLSTSWNGKGLPNMIFENLYGLHLELIYINEHTRDHCSVCMWLYEHYWKESGANDVCFWLQVSVGTLLAFTIVAVSILILRYVPPDEVPLPSSLQASFRLSQENDEEKLRGTLRDDDHEQGSAEISDVAVESINDPFIEKQLNTSMSGQLHYRFYSLKILSIFISVKVASNLSNDSLGKLNETKRRKTAAFSIASVCIGVLILTTSASATFLPL